MPEDTQRSLSPAHSSEGESADEGSASPQSGQNQTPQLKRRRVGRACDECRRKKIKYDGKVPCTHCTVYSYDCTYDQPSNRRRNPAPQYVEGLEAKLRKMEEALSVVLPGLDISSPQFETRILPQLRAAMAAGNHPLQQNGPMQPNVAFTNDSAPNEGSQDAVLESMINATGKLDLDDQGNWDYHGHSSGMAYLAMLKKQFGGLMPDNIGKKTLLKVSKIPPMIDSPRSAADSPMDEAALAGKLLPSKEVAGRLVVYALDHACALMNCVHRPTFEKNMRRLYDTDFSAYEPSDHKFLSLFYLVLAVGCLYSKDELKVLGLEQAREEG